MPISSKPIEKGTSFNRSSDIKNSDTEKGMPKEKKKKCEFVLSNPTYSFDDMIIEEEVRESIEDAIAIVKYKEKLFNDWNLGKVIKKPANVCLNFYGKPGTGKTMAAHAIASMLGMKILQVNYAEIESKYVGETSKNIVELFSEAENENAIILFDEADALLSKRVTDMSSATDVSVNQTRSVLLTTLDTFGGMVIFTTNFITNYDPAFMRRIPHHIKFDVPNEELRNKLLEHYLDGIVPNDVDKNVVARDYEGITGSDIATAVLSCALKTVRKGSQLMLHADFCNALDKIIKSKKANLAREPVIVSEREISEEYALKQLGRG